MLKIVWPSNSFFTPVRSYYSLTWKPISPEKAKQGIKLSLWVNGEAGKYHYLGIVARAGQNCKWKIASGSFMVKLTQYVKGKPLPQKVWVKFDRWYSVKFVEVK